jgi:hypothetical protein
MVETQRLATEVIRRTSLGQQPGIIPLTHPLIHYGKSFFLWLADELLDISRYNTASTFTTTIMKEALLFLWLADVHLDIAQAL